MHSLTPHSLTLQAVPQHNSLVQGQVDWTLAAVAIQPETGSVALTLQHSHKANGRSQAVVEYQTEPQESAVIDFKPQGTFNSQASPVNTGRVWPIHVGVACAHHTRRLFPARPPVACWALLLLAFRGKLVLQQVPLACLIRKSLFSAFKN